MRILFLYTELASYTIACLRTLSAQPDVSLLIIHYPINKEAPFKFDLKGIGRFVEYAHDMSYGELKSIVQEFEPDKIVSSGWMNKKYLRICFEFRKRAVNILVLDNHYVGGLKQNILKYFGRLLLKTTFRGVWVPGTPQKLYAGILGFKESQIRTGFYCCDNNYFSALGDEITSNFNKHSFPKALLCVARYIPAKNYEFLWKVFLKWKSTTDNEWTLICAGTGEDFPQRAIHPSIEHVGFTQPSEMLELLKRASFFILPSKFEPWGVVVHEFACAGFPLILSKEVGASSHFIAEGKNGWTFDPYNEAELMGILNRIDQLSTDQWKEMSEMSKRLGKDINTEQWSRTLLSF